MWPGRLRSAVRPTTAADRLLAFAAVQTTLVAALAGATGTLTDTAPLLATGHPVSVATSGPAAVAALRTLQMLLLVAVVTALLVPLVVTVAQRRTATSDRTGGRRTADGTTPTAAVFALLAGLVLLAAVLGVPAAVPGQNEALVESRGFSEPAMDWTFDYEPAGDGRGVLTITHDGGDVVDVGALSLRGRGFADVPGADQTASGRWQGSVRASADGVVSTGDSVTVGVRADCHLRLVWDDLVAIGEYDCPDG